MQDALLAILRPNRDWFLTVSDISVWLYGDDTQSEHCAVRKHIYVLRKRGYRFEQRVSTWQPCHGNTRAYRLISEPMVVTREAAA